MIIYVYLKCSTCQKALSFLKDNKIDYTMKEINVTPPSIQELKIMLNYQGGNIKKLLNTSGMLYREMNLSHTLQNMSQEEILSLLSSEGMLIKRPFLLTKNLGLVGFKKIEWSCLEP